MAKSTKPKFSHGKVYAVQTLTDPTGNLVKEVTIRAGRAKPSADYEDAEALAKFLAELDFNGGRVIPRVLLEKHGIVVGPEPSEADLINVHHAMRQLAVLITSFQEVSDYDPARHHNQPPPALWVDHPRYVGDVVVLLHELRRLNDFLEKSLKAPKPIKVAKSAGIVATAGKKFLESYSDAMGKGAAALTIAGIATLSVYLGADKGTAESIWNLVKPGK
jgi:hypothetical protein